jgi:hypothetical protein
MTERANTACALGIRDETLSAWQDDLLPANERDALRTHIATCADCRRRLSAYEAVALALRRQRELEPGDRIWRGVQARTAHGRERLLDMTHISLQRRLAGLMAAAAVLLVALFAYVVETRAGEPVATGTPTVTSTHTPVLTPTLPSSTTVTGPRLSWQPVRLPSGVPNPQTVVAPSNGDVAYTCVAPARGETAAHIYVARDRGQDWARGGDVPVGAQPSTALQPTSLRSPMTARCSPPSLSRPFISIDCLSAAPSGRISARSQDPSF